MREHTEYHPTWDTLAIIMTALVLVICAFVIYEAVMHNDGSDRWLMLAIGIILSVGPMLLFPIRETFDEERRAITLYFVGHSRVISAQDYPEVMERKDLIDDGAVRLCASGGLFGYWGKWRSGDGIDFTSYLTDRKRHAHYLTNGSHIVAINAPEDWIRRMYQ